MARLVLSDASPLIGLARVDGLPWLATLFGSVGVPDEVRREVLSRQQWPDEQAIGAAFETGILRRLDAPSEVRKEISESLALANLDEGEAACIRYALASAGSVLLLMDEKAGRSVAQDHGLPVAGTAALIGMAHQRGLIPSAKAVFARLHASDFRIAAGVIAEILRRVGED